MDIPSLSFPFSTYNNNNKNNSFNLKTTTTTTTCGSHKQVYQKNYINTGKYFFGGDQP